MSVIREMKQGQQKRERDSCRRLLVLDSVQYQATLMPIEIKTKSSANYKLWVEYNNMYAYISDASECTHSGSSEQIFFSSHILCKAARHYNNIACKTGKLTD